jgi:hypothetical protein
VARVSAASAVDRFAVGIERGRGDEVAVRCDDVPEVRSRSAARASGSSSTAATSSTP